MNRALCIGINDYPGVYNDLNGCVNDATDWSALLLDLGFKTEVLTNEQATHDNITNKLAALLNDAGEGDVVVLTYSGHGTQVEDTSGDEEDGYDEALYVYDGLLLDDELRTLLDQADPKATVYIVLDSCFSGTGTRINSFSKPRFKEYKKVLGFPKSKFLQHTDMVELLLTGSDDDEYSYDAYIDGKYNGAMTYYAIKSIRELTNPTWQEAFDRLREQLPSREYPQSPQLEGTDEMKALKVFGAKSSPSEEPPVEEPPTEEPPEETLPADYVVYVIIGVSMLILLVFFMGVLNDLFMWW